MRLQNLHFPLWRSEFFFLFPGLAERSAALRCSSAEYRHRRNTLISGTRTTATGNGQNPLIEDSQTSGCRRKRTAKLHNVSVPSVSIDTDIRATSAVSI
ncbi:hypothetical protein GDO78_022330 [Eleutherodactylus coqui]|uniref:Uncharacterized protein n=1 Tax=Eleutherodactylus coqui TaxID=57060 RepID=A0A8J6JUC5_ELECQ|nr:hypothetical protein GDO78_022330 [Eleutherodactylus coqui]